MILRSWTARSARHKGRQQRPTLIIVNSHIGWGSPHKQDTAEAHGEALGVEEIKLTKEFYGWPPDAQFLVPDEAKAYMEGALARGAQWEQEWDEKYKAWATGFSGSGEAVGVDTDARAAGRLGQRHSDVSRRRQGVGDRASRIRKC